MLDELGEGDWNLEAPGHNEALQNSAVEGAVGPPRKSFVSFHQQTQVGVLANQSLATRLPDPSALLQVNTLRTYE